MRTLLLIVALCATLAACAGLEGAVSMASSAHDCNLCYAEGPSD